MIDSMTLPIYAAEGDGPSGLNARDGRFIVRLLYRPARQAFLTQLAYLKTGE